MVAIFAERKSRSIFLQEQEMTRYDAVNFIAHGVSKNPNYEETKELEDGDKKDGIENTDNTPEKETALAKYCLISMKNQKKVTSTL